MLNFLLLKIFHEQILKSKIFIGKLNKSWFIDGFFFE